MNPTTSKRIDDAYVAHSALSTAQVHFYNPDRHGDPEGDASMTNDENDLYKNMLVNIQVPAYPKP